MHSESPGIRARESQVFAGNSTILKRSGEILGDRSLAHAVGTLEYKEFAVGDHQTPPARLPDPVVMSSHQALAVSRKGSELPLARTAPERDCRDAVHLGESQSHLLGHEVPKVAKAEVIAVGSIEKVLSGVE